MTNDQLLAAWKRKLPNVEPTDQELTAFALGVEVGQVELATQVALVEKCMVAMNENADRGEKAEAELTKLKAQPVQGSETSSATFRAMLFAFVRMSLVNPSEAQLHQLDRIIEFYGELKFASQLKLLAHQARTPHINRTAGRLVFSGQGVAAPVQPAPQPQFVQCRYGDSGYACCEGRSCEADEHNDADKGKKADAEVARLVRKLALEREELKAELAKLKAQPVQPALTDGQIMQIAKPFIRSVGGYSQHEDAIPDNGAVEDFARAIEAAVRTGGAG